MAFKVIVAGSRDFTDYELLKRKLDVILASKVDEGIVVISGTARGADKLGERYAKERGYEISSKPADWDRYGKAAGHRRNAEMADEGDALVAFWDGKSRGTAGMIELAKKKNLLVRTIIVS